MELTVMSSVPLHKHPVQVRATEFKFLRTQSLPTIMVLEVYTEANPLRIGFDKEQLVELARTAGIAAQKCEAL
jgi:hypothetical protein